MSEWIELNSAGGSPIAAWLAAPAGQPRGGVVVVQEIFGVNHHIRAVAERFAAEGYLAIAPAVFDRVEKGVELEYNQDGVKRGMEIVGKVAREAAIADIAAAVARVASAGKVGVVGFCYGGTMAWLSAARTEGVSAAVGYYGGGVIGLKDLKPLAPTMLHFGEKDAHIPLAGVREVEAAHPDVPVYVYPADHGFNCDERGSYDAPSAKLAWGRTLDFFARHLA
ncbi:MAG: dienelactone hydrolase family protein [Hyphomicrobiales bacterium]|nr:dienelactone hydrolase family protein [Hyphomicrobiales bacterium]